MPSRSSGILGVADGSILGTSTATAIGRSSRSARPCRTPVCSGGAGLWLPARGRTNRRRRYLGSSTTAGNVEPARFEEPCPQTSSARRGRRALGSGRRGCQLHFYLCRALGCSLMPNERGGICCQISIEYSQRSPIGFWRPSRHRTRHLLSRCVRSLRSSPGPTGCASVSQIGCSISWRRRQAL